MSLTLVSKASPTPSPHGHVQLLWAGIMADLPVFVFLLALFAWFLFKAIIDIVNLSGTPSVSQG